MCNSTHQPFNTMFATSSLPSPSSTSMLYCYYSQFDVVHTAKNDVQISLIKEIGRIFPL